MLAPGTLYLLHTDSVDEAYISSMLFTFCGGADGDIESLDDLVMMLSVPLECRLAGGIMFPVLVFPEEPETLASWPADSSVSQSSK